MTDVVEGVMWMTGFMDEPDAVHGDEHRKDRDVERDEPQRKRQHSDQPSSDRDRTDEPWRPRSDDERIDEASEESFPASDPPQQP